MVDATSSGGLFPPEILDEIFQYIGDSKPRTRRPGYTYEPDSDDENEEEDDEEYESDGLEAGWVGEGLGKYDRIRPGFFGFNEADFTDLDLREDYGWGDEVLSKHSPHVFFPTYTLRPLVLVCKAWKGVAERRLYGSISIGSDNDDTGANAADHLECLLETLTENPRLAALVQELRFSTMSLSSDESCDQILIMELCPNVTHFTLMGYNGEVLVDYHNALTRLRHLKSLTISKFDLRDTECVGFCSIDQLISFMYGWPELESVFFHRSASSCGLIWKDDGMEAPEEKEDEDDEDEDVDPNDEWEIKRREFLQRYREERLLQKPIQAALREKLLNPPAAACPHLRSVVLRDCNPFAIVHIQALRTIAPALEELHAGLCVYSDKHLSAVRKALTQWAPTLRSFGLKPYHLDSPLVIDSELASRLQALRTLRGNVLLISVPSLALLKSLRRLSLSVVQTEEVEQLKSVVPQLPLLRRVELWSMVYSISDKGRVNLARECADPLKKLCDERRIIFRPHGIR